MKEEFSFGPTPGKLKIIKLPGGREFVRLDAQSSEYHFNRRALSKFALASVALDSLPRLGYLFPVSSVEAVKMWQHFGLHRSASVPTEHVALREFLPTIQIAVAGRTKDGDYSEGTSVKFSAGIFHSPSITTWRNWRYLNEIWTLPIWEKAGFDFRKADPNSSAYKTPMNVIEIVKECDLFETVDDEKWLHLEALRIWNEPYDLQRIPARRASLGAPSLETFVATGRANSFIELADVTALLPRRTKLLLALNLLFNYWERNGVPSGHRSFHMVRLGMLSGPSRPTAALDDNNLWNYCAEAGCIPQPRSILLKNIEQIRKQARRYFKAHPEALAKMERLGESSLLHTIFSLPPVSGRRSKIRTK